MHDVTLEPMNEREYGSFIQREISDYATESVAAGRWLPDEAMAQSRKAHEDLLPSGRETANQHFFTVREEGAGEEVGAVWFAIIEQTKEKEAFVYYIETLEGSRGKGFGGLTLMAVEKKARELGASKISLHAFWHNQRAISLYKRVGYAVTSVNMSKRIR
jgi:ribosomal protein S18 acetylase RimI-like enzyme